MEGSEGKGGFVFCGTCGERLDSGVRFCTSCGANQDQFARDVSAEAGDHRHAGEEADDVHANAPTEAMPGPVPHGGSGGQVMEAGQRGFFESLFDIRFEHLITPKLVRFFYALSILVLGVGAIVMIVAAFVASETSGVLFLFLVPLMALFYLITIRLWLELIVVAFKIRDSVERVVENTGRPDA